MNKICLFVLFVSLLTNTLAAAGHLAPEKWYQVKWCAEHNGRTEERMVNGVRVDCLTATHAIEFDFAVKWYEGMSQALYYSMLTGRRAGLVLIVEDPREQIYVERARLFKDCYGLPVDLVTIGPAAR